jgi:hypothetical protein
MPIEIPFDKWKKKFAPVIYEDTGAYCYEHESENLADPANCCNCEFLRTFELAAIAPGCYDAEEYGDALRDCRVWTWHNDGRITSGVDNPRAELLITKKPWQTDWEVI